MLPFCLCGHIVLTKTRKNRNKRLIETGNQKPTHQTTSKSSIAVRIENNEISRLDFKAAQNFYFFVKMHFIFMALKLIPFIHIYICLNNKQDLPSENREPGSEAECVSVIKAFYFTGAFLDCFYSSIANPAAFQCIFRLLLLKYSKSRRVRGWTH